MQPSQFENRRDVRNLGARFFDAVRSGDASSEALFERISGLSGSHAAPLSDVAVKLCGVRPTPGNAEEVFRCQLAGARLVTQCGLAFDPDLVNRELVPLLVKVPAVSVSTNPEDLCRLRLERVMALGQLAPVIEEGLVDQALRSAMLHAKIRGSSQSCLFFPIAGFEDSFRSFSFGHDTQLRKYARAVCLESIAGIYEMTVDAISDAVPETFSTVPKLLPWVNSATIALLTLMPSVHRDRTDETDGCMERIIDKIDWLLRRPAGFPGSYPLFTGEERDRFEVSRSMLSLAAAVLVAGGESYGGHLDDLKIPRLEGAQYLGTALFAEIQRSGVEGAVERFTDITEVQLQRLEESDEMDGQAIIEVAAFQWHLGAASRPELLRLMQTVRQPSAQLFIAKALKDDDPWERR